VACMGSSGNASDCVAGGKANWDACISRPTRPGVSGAFRANVFSLRDDRLSVRFRRSLCLAEP
jgi:hypothetical protein